MYKQLLSKRSGNVFEDKNIDFRKWFIFLFWFYYFQMFQILYVILLVNMKMRRNFRKTTYFWEQIESYPLNSPLNNFRHFCTNLSCFISQPILYHSFSTFNLMELFIKQKREHEAGQTTRANTVVSYRFFCSNGMRVHIFTCKIVAVFLFLKSIMPSNSI